MTSRLRTTSLGFVVALVVAGVATAQEQSKADAKDAAAGRQQSEGRSIRGRRGSSRATHRPRPTRSPKQPKTETATFGGGCFWCTEAVFERIPGVKSVVSGYSGGLVPNPSYEMVCTGQTGHAEVVEVVFDPDKVPYEDLLKVFWTTHDPTTLNAQGPDFGTQYRSIILYRGDEQKKTAQKVFQEMKARKTYRAPVVTELVPFVAFYPAEPYHQDYYRNHPFEEYSLAYIVPKLRKMQAHPRPEPTPRDAKAPAR